ncbi:hypothetical protein FLCH110379_04030 [Flavobacterium chungbukense]
MILQQIFLFLYFEKELKNLDLRFKEIGYVIFFKFNENTILTSYRFEFNIL